MGNQFLVQYSLSNNEIKLDTNCEIFEKENVKLFLLGNIYTNQANEFYELNLEEIYKLYKEYHLDIQKYLDGVYSLIIIDDNMVYVFQDYLASNTLVYFYKDEHNIIVSNELKKIIYSCDNDFAFNQSFVEKFLLQGFDEGESTIVEGISKIPPSKYLKVDLSKREICLCNDTDKKNQTSKTSQKDYIEVMKKICENLDEDKIGMTISSGYDSNFIMHNMVDICKEKINAFCIGGELGRNEIADSSDICDNYDNVIFNKGLVNGSSLEAYPEIVLALEGAMYEDGIFLQYELGKLVKEKDVETLILGECTDQIFKYRTYHAYAENLKLMKYYIWNFYDRVFRNLRVKPYIKSFEMASHIIIKKNGLMMNYFGIKTKYPYIRKPIIAIAENVVIFKDERKKFHRQAVNSCLKEEILPYLQKLGGTTGREALFTGDITKDKLKDFSVKSKFYKKAKFKDELIEMDYYLKILYLELFDILILQKRYTKDNINDFSLKEFIGNHN